MAIKTIKAQIGDGPSREALFDALKYACDKETPHRVVFSLSDGTTCTAQITGLRHEDGSGESFIVTGTVLSLTRGRNRISVGGRSHLLGYYNTRKRRGFLEQNLHPAT